MAAMNERAPGEREVWQIGGLQLDVGQQRVLRGADEIPLPKLSFELLLTLARRAPDVVSYDELMDSVWPGLVVSPETIVQRVRLLRAAIGDEASGPRYIEALRSRGYRLVATANRVARENPPASAAPAAAPRADPPPTATPDAAPPAMAPAYSHAPEAAAGGQLPRRLIVTGAVAFAALLVFRLLREDVPSRSPDAASRAPRAQAGENVDRGDAAPTTANDPQADAVARAARTVAVLPFDNLSADASDAFVALAVPESTLDRLATLRNITVIARDSAFKAGREMASARELGQRLGAAWLVQGSTQRQGNRILVTARLIDARIDAQVWSGRFERPLEELYRLQDEIASGVTDVLAARLTGLQRGAMSRDYSPNVEANLAYLRGRVLGGRYTIVEAEASAAQFERAVRLDPQFAAAQAALYDVRMQAAALRREGMVEARRRYAPLIDAAFATDARAGSAYLARARWSGASAEAREADFKRGLELEPSNSAGMVAFSELLDQAKRPDEAARWLARALLIDPLSPRGLFRSAMRTFDAAGAGVESEMLAVLERDPVFYPALQRYAKYRWQLAGEAAEAIEIIERAIASDPENPWGRHTAVAFYLDVNEPEAARAVAEGTQVSTASTATIRAQYAGDLMAASRAAAGIESSTFGLVEMWGMAEALRDAALRKGRGSSEERLLRQAFAESGRVEPGISVFNYRARLLLAHLKLTQGERAAAERDLRELIAWMNTNERYGLHHRPRALAYMLLGERERALQQLADSLDKDRDYRHWWYFFDREPIWAPVRDDPRFLALRDRVREHAARQRARLEAMRASGQVPRRG